MEISKLRNDGLLDSLMSSCRNAGTDESLEILRFVNDPDLVINELSASQNGMQQLEIIESIFDYHDYSLFSEKMKNLYPESIDVISQTAEDFKDINFFNQNNSRAAFEANLNWDTIAFYSGFCAATSAGLIAASYGGLWVRVAGYVAAVAGTTSMCVQIGIWSSANLINDWVSSLFNHNGEAATIIANSIVGKQLLTISIATFVPYATGCACPVGKELIANIKMTWDDFMILFLSKVPSWMVIGFDTIGVKISL